MINIIVPTVATRQQSSYNQNNRGRITADLNLVSQPDRSVIVDIITIIII